MSVCEKRRVLGGGQGREFKNLILANFDCFFLIFCALLRAKNLISEETGPNWVIQKIQTYMTFLNLNFELNE